MERRREIQLTVIASATEQRCRIEALTCNRDRGIHPFHEPLVGRGTQPLHERRLLPRFRIGRLIDSELCNDDPRIRDGLDQIREPRHGALQQLVNAPRRFCCGIPDSGLGPNGDGLQSLSPAQ